MARLHLDHISKYYRRRKSVFDDLELVVQDKEFIVLLGPSETGKSTLLRMIAGIEKTSDGTIYIGDAVVNKKTPSTGAVAMVFQNHALYPRMTIRENIAYSLKLQGMSEQAIQEAVAQAAEWLDLTGILEQKPSGITAEQRQIVAIARAIAREPKLVLLDEPFMALDTSARHRMRQKLQEIYRQMDAVFLYATHDPAEAMAIGTKILVLRDGQIQQMDTPQAVYQHPANVFVAGLIGVPAMNFWKAQVIRTSASSDDKTEILCLQMEGLGEYILSSDNAELLSGQGYIGHEIIVGVRPEHIRLQQEGTLRAIASFYGMTGADGQLYLESQDQKVTVRVERGQEPELGTVFVFTMDESDIHFFDTETQNRIE